MSRKKKKRQAAGRSHPGTPPRFRVDDHVRVVAGIRDEEYPDIPLGGWAGQVTEIDTDHTQPLYLVRWSKRTLENVHPVYLRRCERDEVEPEYYWLEENKLELDSGAGPPMEQPTTIVPRPLRPQDQGDRLRAIMGLTTDDPLPPPDKEQLRRYHSFLSERLSVPFNAEIWVQTGPFQGRTHVVTVYRLLDPDESGERTGLVVEAGMGQESLVMPLANLEAGQDSPNRRLVQDYTAWFSGDGSAAASDETETEPTPGSLWKTVLRFTVYGMGLGAVLGALLATQGDSTLYAMYIGAGVLAVFGYLFGARYGLLLGAVNRVRGGPLVGGILGAIAGSLLGATGGVLLLGALGSIPGSIVGNLLGTTLAKWGWKPFGNALWSLLGACAGGMLLAFLTESDNAITGALAGILVGGVMTAVIVLFVVVTLGMMLNARQ